MAQYHLKDKVKYKDKVYFIGGCSKRDGVSRYYLCGSDGDVGNVTAEELSPYPDFEEQFDNVIEKMKEAFKDDDESFKKRIDEFLDGADKDDYPWANETPEEREEKIENFFKFLEDIGKDDPPNAHYSRLDPQPIEYMQQAMTPEQFQGFCLGNVLKYALRFGHKDAREKEAQKIADYAKWLLNSTKGEKICLKTTAE